MLDLHNVDVPDGPAAGDTKAQLGIASWHKEAGQPPVVAARPANA